MMMMFRFPAIVILSFLQLRSVAAGSSGCHCRRCGNVHIPYPFSLEGPNCSFTNAECPSLPEFKTKCNENANFGKGFIPFLPTYYREYQVLNIYNDHLTINSTWFRAVSCESDKPWRKIELLPGPFTISSSNKFVAFGCSRIGIFVDEKYYIQGGCVPICNIDSRSPKYCSGDICCETPIPTNHKFFQIYANYKNISQDPSECSISTIVDPDNFNESNIDNIRNGVHMSMNIDWAIGNDTCLTAEHGNSLDCANNARCVNASRGSGYLCECNSGYQGDGYREGTGCTGVYNLDGVFTLREKLRSGVPLPASVYNSDIDECATSHNCWLPHARCENTDGSYMCHCAKFYSGDGFKNGTRCHVSNLVPLISCATFTVMLLVACGLKCFSKQRATKLQKLKYFEQNGGLRLQHLFSSNAARGEEGTRIFSLNDLHMATNNFSESLILGEGGYGKVYKGTLAEGTVVAIKKSKAVYQNDIDQFVNELNILSRINHRNVVKLLGCCLETSVPLLVYEYISNGTLFQHLNGKYEQHLRWEDRLRIATGTAEALAYLHSGASVPIIHRDVKSSNILLDGTFTAKVSDFGVSRQMPMDQTHVSTNIQGTPGYLDPEYFQTLQLTGKSDVYSFGVVLAELLTSMKPVSCERLRNEINLSDFFLSASRMDRLVEIIDARLVEENRLDDMDSMRAVASLTKDCLSGQSEKRPSMKEVAQQLLWIRDGRRSKRGHAWMARDDALLQNEEESVALIMAQEGRDQAKPLPSSSNTSSSVYFSVEGFRSSFNSGR